MKITGTASITGRGLAVFTDEPWSAAKSLSASKKRKLRITSESRIVEIEIKSVEAVLMSDQLEFLSFLVPSIPEKEIKDLIQGREVELI